MVYPDSGLSATGSDPSLCQSVLVNKSDGKSFVIVRDSVSCKDVPLVDFALKVVYYLLCCGFWGSELTPCYSVFLISSHFSPFFDYSLPLVVKRTICCVSPSLNQPYFCWWFRLAADIVIEFWAVNLDLVVKLGDEGEVAIAKASWPPGLRK